MIDNKTADLPHPQVHDGVYGLIVCPHQRLVEKVPQCCRLRLHQVSRLGPLVVKQRMAQTITVLNVGTPLKTFN